MQKDFCCIKIKKVRKKGMLPMKDMLQIWVNNKENSHSTRTTIKNSNKKIYKMKETNNNKTNQ